MEVQLAAAQTQFVKEQVDSGRYLDESEVVREALRILEAKSVAESFEDPALEAALLEGIESDHYPYDQSVRNRIQANAVKLSNGS